MRSPDSQRTRRACRSKGHYIA